MKRNSDGIGFFSKWMITNVQIAVAFKKLGKLALMLLEMHFCRNEMLHDMRVSKKNQSKLVSYLIE